MAHNILQNEKIFIQIAAYRDPEINPTLQSLFNKAKYPNNLKVCICNQYSNDDSFNLDEWRDDDRVQIIDMPYEEAPGVCWARNRIQQEYSGEKYTLQLDSHHRFVKNWDARLIKMLEKLRSKGHSKPLLTAYIPSYDPENDPKSRIKQPWRMKFDRFTPEGAVFFMPYTIEPKSPNPIPARYFSAHFAFADGTLCTEVPHDPNLYFHGEEISLAVRAYTHGYDLFHPNEVIAWHEYTRKGRTKHWDDHSNWNDINKESHARLRKLLGIDGECAPCVRNKLFKEYGLGKVRTQAEYEEYAGIRFNDRAVRMSCIEDKIPGTQSQHEPYHQKFKHAIDLHPSSFPTGPYTFVAVILEDKNGNSLYRKDELGELFNNNLKQTDFFQIWVDQNIPKPYKWIVWAHNNDGWAERIEQIL